MKNKFTLNNTFNTIRILRRLWRISGSGTKLSIKLLIFSQFLNGILEMLTLFSVVPFIQAITNINILYENKYINYIKLPFFFFEQTQDCIWGYILLVY